MGNTISKCPVKAMVKNTELNCLFVAISCQDDTIVMDQFYATEAGYSAAFLSSAVHKRSETMCKMKDTIVHPFRQTQEYNSSYERDIKRIGERTQRLHNRIKMFH
ncbi:hypothetical protein FKM82_004345 [Ascaphus truei]